MHRSVEETLAGPGLFVGREGGLDAGFGGDFGDGDVPPAFETGDAGVLLDWNVDDDGAGFGAGAVEGGAEVGFGGGAVGDGAEALGVVGEVDREVVAVEAVGATVAVAKLVTEGGGAGGHLEPADALETTVVGDDNDEFVALLDRGDDL